MGATTSYVTAEQNTVSLTKLCSGNSSSISASIANGARIKLMLVCPIPLPSPAGKDGRACRAVASDARVESDCSATAFIIKDRRTFPCSVPPADGGGDLTRM